MSEPTYEEKYQRFRELAETPDHELIWDLFSTLAPNYMKPSTATTDEGRTNDAMRDAAFLDAACREAWAKFKKWRSEEMK